MIASTQTVSIKNADSTFQLVITAADDGSMVTIRSGTADIIIPAEAFFVFVNSIISVDAWLDDVEARRKAH